MFDLKKLWAYTVLAWNFAIHLLSKPFRRDESGLLTYEEKYAPDRIYRLGAADRESLPARMACIGCGRCDEVCPSLLVEEGKNFAGPAAHAMAFDRSLVDLGTLTDQVDCVRCGACSPVCPTDVPLERLFDALRDRFDRVERQEHDRLLGDVPARVRETGTVDGQPDRRDRQVRGRGERLLFSCACRPGGSVPQGIMPGAARLHGCCGALEVDLWGRDPMPETVDAVLEAVDEAGASEVVCSEARCHRMFMADKRYRARFRSRLLLESLPEAETTDGASGDGKAACLPGSDLVHHLDRPELSVPNGSLPILSDDSGWSGAAPWARPDLARALAERLFETCREREIQVLYVASPGEAAFLRSFNRPEPEIRSLISPAEKAAP